MLDKTKNPTEVVVPDPEEVLDKEEDGLDAEDSQTAAAKKKKKKKKNKSKGESKIFFKDRKKTKWGKIFRMNL